MSRKWGWLLVGAGLLLVMASIVSKMTQSGASYGGVILIGPIPIVFGSSPEMAAASMILAGVLVLLWPREDEAALLAGIAELDRNWRSNGSEADQGGKSGEDRKREGVAASMRGGAVLMIGPVPIVVGSDPRKALLLMIMALAMMAVYALVIKGFLR